MDFLNHAHGTGQGIRRRATFAIETKPTALAIVKPAHFTIQALLTLFLRLVPALLAQHTRRLPFPKTIRPRTAVFARGLPLCFGKGRHGTHLARKRRFPWLTVPFRAEQALHPTVPPTVSSLFSHCFPHCLLTVSLTRIPTVLQCQRMARSKQTSLAQYVQPDRRVCADGRRPSGGQRQESP